MRPQLREEGRTKYTNKLIVLESKDDSALRRVLLGSPEGRAGGFDLCLLLCISLEGEAGLTWEQHCHLKWLVTLSGNAPEGL